MEDYIARATAANGTVRAFAAVTTNTVQRAHDVHGTSGVATAALGRTLTAAAMLGRMFKNRRDVVTIQIKGDGPLGGIIAISDQGANVRGYVYNPEVELPLNGLGKFDVSSAVGRNGYLNVIKDLGLKEPYIGYVDLATGEIGDDMAYYFAYSEQIPSVVSLGVLVAPDGNVLTAGGYIIQLMPGAEEGIAEFLEKRVASLPPVTNILSGDGDPEAILHLVLGDLGLDITESVPCRYLCNCSRDRMERNLMSLGKMEILEMANEQHEAELQCHFCSKKYYFTEQELLELTS